MRQITFSGRIFEHLGEIDPAKDEDGQYLSLSPQARFKGASTSRLHAYGKGPFCRFVIARGRHNPGLYVLTCADYPVYAGECADVGRRWGAGGYGGISPRNCFVGGQATNCRVNAAILAEVQGGQRIDLWFVVFSGSREERKAAEEQLIQALNPPWNVRK
jgi:hypothetical protein